MHSGSVQIQTLSGKVFFIDVDKFCKVSDLRCAVAEVLSLRPGYLRLVRGTSVLGNGEPCNVLAGETLFAFAVKKEPSELLTTIGYQDTEEWQCGWTALHYAAHHGHCEITDVLLDDDDFEEINATDTRGETALHLATSRGHVTVIEAILKSDRFLSANVCNRDGETALHYAVCPRKDAFVADKLGVVHALLSCLQFTDVSAMDKDGNSALHLAASRGEREIVEALLADARPIEVGMRDSGGETALQRASARNHSSTVEVLRAAMHQAAEDGSEVSMFTDTCDL